jgi:TP901 family phage tail tape measure protein
MAKEIKSVVKIGMNYTEVVGGTTEVNRRIRLLDSEFRKAQESAKAFGTATDELRNKQDYLTQKIELQTKKVNNMKDEYEKIRKEKGENSKEAEKYATKLNYAERQLIKLEGELQKTSEQLKEQSTRFADLQEKLEKYGEKAENISSATGEIGGAFLKLSAPMIAFSVASGKMAMDFEEAMAKVSLMVDENEVDMKQLETSVKTLSNTYGISTKEIANALYETMSAGISAADSIEFLEVAIKNSRGGITETTTSVNTLTNVMNAYNIETDRAIEISDKLLMLQKFGKTTVGEFGNELGRLAPLGAQVNMSVEEMFGSIATLTKNSIQSSQAITGMRSIISSVISPTSEATKEAERLGLQFNASALQGKGFEKFLDDVMRKTRGNTDSLTKLFGNVNALNAIMLLTSEKGSKDFKEALEAIYNAIGMTDESMEKLDTRSQRLSETIQSFKNGLTDAGNAILPILDTILKVLTPLFTLLSNMNPVLIQMIAILGLFLATTGSILKTISGLTGMWGNLAKGMAGFNLTAMKTALIVMGVVAALIALLTLITVLTGKTDDLERSTRAIGDSVGNIQGNVNNAMNPTGNMKRVVSGSHRMGLDYVPRDNYIAELHEGERVLTKEENKRYSEGNGQIVNVYVQADDLQQVVDVVRLFEDLRPVSRQGV